MGRLSVCLIEARPGDVSHACDAALPVQHFCVRQMTLTTFRSSLNCNCRHFRASRLGWPDSWSITCSVFPEGQLVVADPSGRILGSASSLLIDWDDYAESANWSAITGEWHHSIPTIPSARPVWRGHRRGSHGPPAGHRHGALRGTQGTNSRAGDQAAAHRRPHSRLRCSRRTD